MSTTRHMAERRVLCAHADQNGDGAHWRAPDEPCPLASGDRGLRPWEQANLDRLVAAAGIDPEDLPDTGRRILRWLAGWDDHTTTGLEQILHAARSSDA